MTSYNFKITGHDEMLTIYKWQTIHHFKIVTEMKGGRDVS